VTNDQNREARCAALRADFHRYREDFHRYEDAARSGAAAQQLAKLRKRAAKAFDELGGQPELASLSLRDYNHDRFGPYLGVSGEPDAAASIREAALASPKVVALALTDPLEVGVAHDAERLGSIGELPSGPDEYREIRLECVGRILTSTNIGSRVNLRFYGHAADIWVNPAPLDDMKQTAIESLRKRLAPFLNTPDGRPRPTTVYVRFRSQVAPDERQALIRALRGEIQHPETHSLVLVQAVRKGSAGVRDTLEAIAFAADAGLNQLAVQGTTREAADEMLSLPGLLNYFNPTQAARIFDVADAAGVQVTTRNRVDCQSVARLIWTGLATARRMGLELGKYALFPLTLDESAQVIESIQRWLGDWTAAPAFYVDIDTITEGQVFPRRRAREAAMVWLDMVAANGVQVVLIDTVLKSEGRHLLKTDPNDSAGIFTLDAIHKLDQYARDRGVKVLWAGGITVAQAYELARLEVFGLYVTSAVARLRAVGPDHEADPGLAAERFPTRDGVARVKLAIEAGFVETKLRKLGDHEEAARIEAATHDLLTRPPETADESALRERVTAAWQELGR